MRHIKLFLLLAIALAVPMAAHAQTAVYGEFSGATLSVGQPHIYGGTFGIYDQRTYGGFLGLGGDARGFVLSGNNGKETFHGGLVGPRLAIRPRAFPLSPYAEILVGIANTGFGNSSSTDFAYHAVFGADWTVIPHVDWRVLEYTYGEEHGLGIAYKALSTGIVIRLR
jgi:hypothetical protein